MAAEQVQRISVIDPIAPAIERVKIMLFSPFDLAKWFTVGFCAWLTYLGQGGGGFNLPFDAFKQNRHWHHNDVLCGNSCQSFGHIAAWFTPLVIAIVIIVAVIGVAIGIVLLWLSSRGRFMFLHCVAENKAEVVVPWHKYGPQGNSLFVFRLVAGIASIIAIALVAGVIAALGFLMHCNGAPIWAMVIALVFISFVTFLPALIVVAIFFKFTNDFVVPIMFLRQAKAVEGWREFLEILSAHKGSFALYILFQIVIAIAIGVIMICLWLTLALSCCCCCIGGIIALLLLTPYIGTVILLPIPAFKLAYSLNYLRQFGPAYNVFAVSE